MSELPPDIPAWSPLAERGRALGGVATDPGEVGPTDEVPGGPAGRPARRRGALWAVAGLLAGLVLALAVFAAVDDDPAPPTTTTVRAPLPATSFDDPAPLGTKVALGNGWSVVVRGFNSDATRALAALNRGSPPLEKGHRLVMVDVELTYLDGVDESASPFDGVDLALMGEDGVLVTPADTPCVPSKPVLDQTTELPRGSTERGRLCFAVAATQVASLRLVAEPSMTFGSRPSYLSLRRPAG